MYKLKRISLFLFTCLLASCNFAHFDRYPGKAMAEIPLEFRGTYAAGQINKIMPGDSIYFHVYSDSICCSEKGRNTAFLLNESCFVSGSGDDIYLSQLKPGTKTYIVFHLKTESSGIRVTPITNEKQSPAEKYLKYSLTNPNDSSSKVFVMDEAGLKKYITEDLSKKESFFLRKVK